MATRFRVLIFPVLLLCGASAFGAEESLYDRAKARTLTAEQRAMFGPRSAELRYDARMIRAAEIARKRAHPATTWYCWRYVKDAMLAANLISSRPRTAFANQAGDELRRSYGFRKLSTLDPYRAPWGAVIVYGGDDGGHVELRTESGFVSDFLSSTPYPRPVQGIYVKPS